jgi:hypothetical protein
LTLGGSVSKDAGAREGNKEEEEIGKTVLCREIDGEEGEEEVERLQAHRCKETQIHQI